MSTLQTDAPVAPFSQSRTCRNLCSACLGEQQARRLYLRCARRMEEESLHVIAHAFRFTAAQEKEHADILSGLLTAHHSLPPSPQEDAPLPLPREPLELLRTVVQSEHDEWDRLYPHYAAVAQEEGYPRIAGAFLRIAETEHIHARRFLQYAKALAEGSLFRETHRTTWLCLPCGQLHTGCEPPQRCSGCSSSRGHFIRSNFFPFSVEG